MRYSELRSYVRSLRDIGNSARREAVHEAIRELVDCLERGSPPSQGLGLKKLRPAIWEIRSALKDRILFSWTGDLILFLVAGDHEDIRRALKRL